MIAHIAGIPVEETVGSLGPALLMAFGAAAAGLRARYRSWTNRGLAPPREREYARTMRDALRRWHCWLSLAVGFACLIVALWTGPAVMLVLVIVGCGLLFDGVTMLWAGAARAGGLSDHRQ